MSRKIVWFPLESTFPDESLKDVLVWWSESRSVMKVPSAWLLRVKTRNITHWAVVPKKVPEHIAYFPDVNPPEEP